MGETSALNEKREQVRRLMAPGEYKTLIDLVLDGVGRLVQRLSRSKQPPPAWYPALLVALLTLLAGALVSLAFDRFPSPAIKLELVWLAVSLSSLAFAATVVIKAQSVDLLALLREEVLDAIVSVDDLEDLEGWLGARQEAGEPLFFGLMYGTLLTLFAVGLWAVAKGAFLGFGPLLWALVLLFQAGVLLYYIFLVMALSLRLSRYRFKLFAADPSSSWVIEALSDQLNFFVVAVTLLLVLVTLIFASADLLPASSAALLILVGWGPLTALFLVNHYALSKVIVRAKWETLERVQAQVEAGLAAGDLKEKETVETVARLMDYHDRVKATRNTALDIRAGLSFLNSLLLPLIAFVLANFEALLGGLFE